MKKEQIDNFFAKARQILELSNENIDEQILIEMFKLSSGNIRDELGSKNIYELKIQDYEKLFEDIIGQIQKNELYEYFLKVGTEKGNLKIFEVMLPANIQIPVEIVEKIIKDDNLLEEVEDIGNLIEKTKDVEFIKKCVKDNKLNMTSIERGRLIKLTGDKEFIKECLEDNGLKIGKSQIKDLIISTEDEEFIKKCVKNTNLRIENWEKVELIKLINDEEFTKECLEESELGLENWEKVELIKLINDEELIAEYLENEKMGFDVVQKATILSQLDNDKKIGILKEIKTQRKEITKELRALGGFNQETNTDNLRLILQWEDIENPEEKIKILQELHEKNQEIIQNVNFEILDERYIEFLGKSKISLIANFPIIQAKVIKLNQNELKMYARMIENCENINDSDSWKYMSNNILNRISGYEKLSEKIDDFTKEDIEIAMQVMQNANNFNITNIEELRNYNRIKQRKCDEWIKTDANILKKEAILFRLFDQDTSYTQELLIKYEQDIEKIENEDIKNYIKALKEIMSIQDNQALEKIYENIPEMLLENVDKTLMERSISNEYEKLYNKGLLKVENLEEIEENVYNAGTNFNILMTSVGAFFKNNGIDDYKKDWNRPSLSSPHICCSYIRNDMIGTAPIHNICYGFSEMKSYSLTESNCHDIGSNATGFISSSTGSKYYSPDNQINNTESYNEMDYSRFQKGKRKQPDYIIVFKENGRIQNLEEAKKASKDWGGMPIVVVDKDRCLEAEKSRLDNLLDKYIAGDKTLAREIYYKIRNNRVTRKTFAEEINIDKFKREMEEQKKSKQEENRNNQQQIKSNGSIEVTKEDMQKNSEQVSAEERKQEMSKMKQLYLQIHSIAKEDKDVELE